MPKYAKTQQLLANEIGCSRSAVVDACRDEDFPKKGKSGYPVAASRKWFKDHGKGPYRRSGGGKQTEIDGLTLTEANIRRTFQQSENERIKKERQLVDQARELGEIVLAKDVLGDISKMIAIVVACIDSSYAEIDRALPEDVEHRDRVLGTLGKLHKEIAVAMESSFQEESQ